MKRKKTTAVMDVSGCDLSLVIEEEKFASFFQREIEKYDVDLEHDVESLDISRCRLGPRCTSCLLSFLSNASSPFTNLKQLCLQRNALGSEGGRAIGKFLSLITQNIQLLDISLNDIKAGGGEPTASSVISDSLLDNSSLSVLIMDKCAIGPDGAKDIARALASNKSITRLDLAGNMIGPLGGDAIFCALKSNSTLRQLGLKMNRIGGCSGKFDIQTLAGALSKGACCLAKLDLSYNDLRCKGCVILSQAMASELCTLIELILEKNDIGIDGTVALANALCANNTLKRLDLKGNKVCDSGAVAIGNSLSRNTALKFLDLASCNISNDGGAAIGRGLSSNSSLEHIIIDKNSLGDGNDVSLFSVGVSTNTSLKKIQLKGNRFANSNDALWNDAIANALDNNSILCYVDLSGNNLSKPSIVDAVAKLDSSVEHFDLSDNNFQHISIETQLELSKRIMGLEMDMSLNPLSSPPLGRLATYSNLKSYLTLLAKEKTAVTRIRLMVLGYGGVGKSTFCRCITASLDEVGRDNFRRSLNPVEDWNTNRLVNWAQQLGTTWSMDAAKLVLNERISGKNLWTFIDQSNTDDNTLPSKTLLDLCSSKYPGIDCNIFVKAIYALHQKGYLSTVGAVKVDGTIQLGTKLCSMVDFAGQVEFLVSHQLLLSSMHTLSMILQPAPSFSKPDHPHFGSWDYWSRFLFSLGDRRPGSLLLALSQIDKLNEASGQASIDSAIQEFNVIKASAAGAINSLGPLMLDYRQDIITDTVSAAKRALATALDEVGHNWWVPESYETLATILQNVAKRKISCHELPMLQRSELVDEIDAHCTKFPNNTTLLTRMKLDSELLQRAIEYLEAVGDVMPAGKWLLLDPVAWFSSFLAHFIKDDLACTTVQVDATILRRQRGTISLDEIVNALGHEYKRPEQHVSQIMSLLCDVEICVSLNNGDDMARHFLFPCLLPPVKSSSDLSHIDLQSDIRAIRGHRFREVSGFVPPGLFVGLLARLYKKTALNTMHSERMWKDHAVLAFNNGATFVLLKLKDATIDVIGWAAEREKLFVGAAKGQQSVVIWITHWIKMYLRNYSQLNFQESWLCPNIVCYGVSSGYAPCEYVGSEFLLSSSGHSMHSTHNCDVDGCWRFLGSGHSLERMSLNCPNICQSCKSKPTFMLRDKVI